MATGEHPRGHKLPALLPAEPGCRPEGDGPGLQLATSQPQQSGQRFFPPNLPCPGPGAGRTGHRGCVGAQLPGLGHGADSHSCWAGVGELPLHHFPEV